MFNWYIWTWCTKKSKKRIYLDLNRRICNNFTKIFADKIFIFFLGSISKDHDHTIIFEFLRFQIEIIRIVFESK